MAGAVHGCDAWCLWEGRVRNHFRQVCTREIVRLTRVYARHRDPFLYTDSSGFFHCLYHRSGKGGFSNTSVAGGHAYSVDGKHTLLCRAVQFHPTCSRLLRRSPA